MNAYSSGKHENLTADPGRECWCSDSAQEYGLTDAGCPRHDDLPLSNPANPALTAFRQMHGHRRGAELTRAAVAWASSLTSMALAGSFTIQEAKHARRVLTRLAQLAEVTR